MVCERNGNSPIWSARAPLRVSRGWKLSVRALVHLPQYARSLRFSEHEFSFRVPEHTLTGSAVHDFYVDLEEQMWDERPVAEYGGRRTHVKEAVTIIGQRVQPGPTVAMPQIMDAEREQVHAVVVMSGTTGVSPFLHSPSFFRRACTHGHTQRGRKNKTANLCVCVRC